jgi:hypothetical protein
MPPPSPSAVRRNFRSRDDRVNLQTSQELHAYGITNLWLVLSPVEAQCLLAGLVPTQVMNRVAILLAPDPLVDDLVGDVKA